MELSFLQWRKIVSNINISIHFFFLVKQQMASLWTDIILVFHKQNQKEKFYFARHSVERTS
jgi:hypothetical protein